MTNYIEEMMKMTGVEKNWTKNFIKDDDGFFNCNFKYPDFTSEKQLEMIKLIGRIDEASYGFDFEGDWYFGVANFHIHNEDFAQALAQLTTELMKAGELDKEKVKDILEC